MIKKSIPVIICLPELRANDAVGNDVVLQFKALKNCYENVYIYAERYEKQFKSYVISWDRLCSLLSIPDTVVIYHHCVFWELGNSIINLAKCNLYLRYHGITPAKFFSQFKDHHSVNATKLGEEQTCNFINSKKFIKFLPTSDYMSKELIHIGANSNLIYILPPFNLIEDFQNCSYDYDLLHKLMYPKQINVLFVGRFVPNKGHIHLINVIKCYTCLYDNNIKLHLVGSFSQNSYYYLQYLNILIKHYCIEQNIEFHFNASFNQLHTLYDKANVFLVLSEHEGFCVPILEAQFHNCPILAYGSTAVKDTVGSDQLVFDQLDYCLFATALREVYTNLDLKMLLTKNGYNNTLKYKYNVIKDLLYNAI